MIDYYRYKEAMEKAREAQERATAAVECCDLPPEDKEKLSNDLAQKVARLRKHAMSFGVDDKPALPSRGKVARNAESRRRNVSSIN